MDEWWMYVQYVELKKQIANNNKLWKERNKRNEMIDFQNVDDGSTNKELELHFYHLYINIDNCFP